MPPQPTCEERIGDELAYELKVMRETLEQLELYDDDEAREEADRERSERPLSVDVTRVVKILLSTGGPADWFEVHIDEEGDPRRVEYIFQDWFDVARVELRDADRELALDYLEPFISYALELELNG